MGNRISKFERSSSQLEMRLQLPNPLLDPSPQPEDETPTETVEEKRDRMKKAVIDATQARQGYKRGKALGEVPHPRRLSKRFGEGAKPTFQ